MLAIVKNLGEKAIAIQGVAALVPQLALQLGQQTWKRYRKYACSYAVAHMSSGEVIKETWNRMVDDCCANPRLNGTVVVNWPV